ncbi:DUF1800 family protein [Micromonospora sp. NBC_01638]|uniref:DUF1800 domain-containing protein n=1 Tax=Micromonospora sp. NBC_01638 TaxID=2975982 RepID=UPI00386A7BAC|nr:DUF1800 domain-containing protein [Micromonospora sp. NBC_01638]
MADDLALLLRRAGFGPTSSELAAAKTAGYDATVATLTAPTAPDVGALLSPMPVLEPDPLAGLSNPTDGQRAKASVERWEQTKRITQWWLDRLTVADHQTREKLWFFWHGHWATSVRKVIRPQLMFLQHRSLRSSLDFAVMAHKMITDPALVYWLDGQTNTRDAPNENLGRELMELFMLGIGRYTERDVKAAGRALTGWKIDYDGARTFFSPATHDAGKKNILGVTKNFDAHSLVDFLLKQDRCPAYIAERLWFRYASSTEPLPKSTRDSMVHAFPNSASMLRKLFADEAFLASAGTLVKQPTEWFVGAMRQLGLRPGELSDDMLDYSLNGLERLGQLPFAPPSVEGWPAGAEWLTVGAAHARLNFAGRIAQLVPAQRLTPEGMAHILTIDTWTNRTYAALKATTDPQRLLTLGLASPEYLVT